MNYLEAKDQPLYERRISLAYYLSFICQGLTSSIFGPAMVWFAARTNSTVAGITPVLICYNIGFIISSLFISNLFDRKPGNRLIACSICVLVCVMPGFCFVNSRTALFMLAFIMGAAMSVIDNGANIMFPWLLRERAKRPMNLVHLFYSVGCTVTPFLIGLSLKRWEQASPVFILLAVLIIYPAVLLFRLPSPRPIPDSGPTASGGTADTGAGQLLAAAGTFGLMLFLFSSCQATFNNWTSTVLLRNGLADGSAAAMMTSIFWIGTFSGRLLATWLVEKRPPALIVLCCVLISVTDGIVMFFARGSLILTGICVFFSGFSTGPVLANVFSIMKGRGFVSARINGIVQACSQLGGMLLPTLFGRIYGDSTSSYIPFVVLTLAASLIELVVLRVILRPGPARE